MMFVARQFVGIGARTKNRYQQKVPTIVRLPKNTPEQT